MGARAVSLAMIAGSVGVMLWLATRPPPAHEPPVRPAKREKPWLTNEAAAQIIGPGGAMGPLFEHVVLGSSPPSPEVRAKIAAFAKANDVEIAFEVKHDELTAVTFAVTFGGCCGYEGADVLALRLGRHSSGVCCVCGPDTWIDDWANVTPDGEHVRARVRVNRVEARWEPIPTFPELLARADGLVGMTMGAARTAFRETFEFSPTHYVLEMPLPLRDGEPYHANLGIEVYVEQGRIVSASLPFQDYDPTVVRATTRKRWGRPRVDDDRWEWRKPDREITLESVADPSRITIRSPS